MEKKLIFLKFFANEVQSILAKLPFDKSQEIHEQFSDYWFKQTVEKFYYSKRKQLPGSLDSKKEKPYNIKAMNEVINVLKEKGEMTAKEIKKYFDDHDLIEKKTINVMSGLYNGVAKSKIEKTPVKKLKNKNREVHMYKYIGHDTSGENKEVYHYIGIIFYYLFSGLDKDISTENMIKNYLKEQMLQKAIEHRQRVHRNYHELKIGIGTKENEQNLFEVYEVLNSIVDLFGGQTESIHKHSEESYQWKHKDIK